MFLFFFKVSRARLRASFIIRDTSLSNADDREGDPMSKIAKRFLADESGATAIEYGLIAALVALALVTALSVLGGKITGVFDKISTAIPS